MTIGTIETVGLIGLAIIVIGGAISIGGARYAAGTTPPEVMFWKIYNDPEQAEIELNAMKKKSIRGMKIAWVGMIICIIGALVVLSMGPLSMWIPPLN